MVQASIQYKDTMKSLTYLEKQQMPFAYAQTLTQLAQLGQLAVRTRMRWAYKLHSDWLPKGILVERANKKDIIQYGLAQAVVYSSKGSTPYVGLHETGGTKRPLPPRKAINMPSITLQRKQYKKPMGSVKVAWKPSTLLRNYNAQKHAVGKKKKKGGESKPYLIQAKGGQPAVVARRRGSSSVGVEVLWLFIKTARIKPKLKAQEAVYKEVVQNMDRLLRVNLTNAMTTVK